MESHFWQFSWEIFNNWAGYFTGGCIMAVITFWHSWNDKTMRRKFLLGLTVLFFTMGAYKAWNDQYQKAFTADKSSDEFRKIAKTKEGLLDNLTIAFDQMLSSNRDPKTIILEATNVSNSAVFQGNWNNVNVGTIINGDTNQLKLDVLLNDKPIMQNSPTGRYDIITLPTSRELKVTVANETQTMAGNITVEIGVPFSTNDITASQRWKERGISNENGKEGLRFFATSSDYLVTPHSSFEPFPPFSLSTNLPRQFFSILKLKEFGITLGGKTEPPANEMFEFFPTVILIYTDKCYQEYAVFLKFQN
jgi:hypothetical protein